MITDPYKVLGLSPGATDDEVKAAYRRLAKKYHPDVNHGSAEAEAKMKEINEAYDQIIKQKNTGASSGHGSAGGNPYGSYGGNPYGNGGYGSSGGGYGSSGGWGGYGNPWGNWGGFGGFGGWGNANGGYGSAGGYGNAGNWSAGQGSSQESPQMQAARNYINYGRYREALNVLANISEHNARWYYYSALANAGLGNRVASLNYAQQAVNMEPNNLEYKQLLQKLQGSSETYRAQGHRYGMPNMNNVCTWLCLSQLCLPFCGFRFFCC